MFTLSAKKGGWHQAKAGQNFHTHTLYDFAECNSFLEVNNIINPHFETLTSFFHSAKYFKANNDEGECRTGVDEAASLLSKTDRSTERVINYSPITNSDWIRCFIHQTKGLSLTGFEPATCWMWTKPDVRSTTVQSSRYCKYVNEIPRAYLSFKVNVNIFY